MKHLERSLCSWCRRSVSYHKWNDKWNHANVDHAAECHKTRPVRTIRRLLHYSLGPVCGESTLKWVPKISLDSHLPIY